MTNLKNLLFDLGGVIMDLDRMRCVHAFEELGMPQAAGMLGEYGQQGPFLALEKGEITAEEFRDAIRPMFSKPVTDEEIDRAFCKFLVGIPVSRLKALRELRRRYKVYLLSNTNPIMFDSFIAGQFRQEGKEIDDYFDGKVVSYKAKCYKPDRAIFEYTCKHCDIEPEETLFFDDSPSNVEAARRFGFNAALVEPGKEFTDVLCSVL